MEQTEKKDCYNCRYFLRYYTSHQGHFYYIHNGHCINTELTLRESAKRKDKNLPCELWQPRKIQKEETRRKIKDTLQFMAQRIDEIAQILKEED